jgi:hypothetical protein
MPLLFPPMMLARSPLKFYLGNGAPGVIEEDADESITITVTDDIATTDVSGTDYTWPVTQAGSGADAGNLDLSGNIVSFTDAATNYQFPISRTGGGGAAISVTDNIASLTIDGINCQWPVAPA